MTDQGKAALAAKFAELSTLTPEQLEQEIRDDKRMLSITRKAVDDFLESQPGVFHWNGVQTAIRLALVREWPDLADDPELDSLVEDFAADEEKSREVSADTMAQIYGDAELTAYWRAHPEATLQDAWIALKRPGWETAKQ